MPTDDLGLGEVQFSIRLRGYDPAQVDPALRAAEQAAQVGEESTRLQAARTLEQTQFQVLLRGYDQMEVDSYVAHLLDLLRADEPTRAAKAAVAQVAFRGSLRGYDIARVDELLEQLGQALVSNDPAHLAHAREMLRDHQLPRRWFYAYDREQIDGYLAAMERRLTSALHGDQPG